MQRPIAWYRGFHDVPRVVCIAASGGSLLFESRFDGAIDDYRPTYEIRFVPLAPDDADAVLHAAAQCDVVAEVPVSVDLFDATRRTQLIVPQPVAHLL